MKLFIMTMPVTWHSAGEHKTKILSGYWLLLYCLEFVSPGIAQNNATVRAQ